MYITTLFYDNSVFLSDLASKIIPVCIKTWTGLFLEE